MKDLQQLWSIDGLVKDRNGDGIADDINVDFMINEGCLPTGLIDFCVRLGFETTGMNFNFINQSNQCNEYKISFKHAEETSISLEANHIVFSYTDDMGILDKLLRFLASEFHGSYLSVNRPVMKIILNQAGMYYFYDNENNVIEKQEDTFTVSHQNTTGPEIHSLTEVWNDLGFMRNKAANPNNNQNFTFEVAGEVSLNTWVEIYYGAARVGMELTEVNFPVSGDSSQHDYRFLFKAGSSDSPMIELKENQVVFTGMPDSLHYPIRYFFQEKHWRNGGRFAVWEETQNSVAKDALMFEESWEDDGEVAELESLLAKNKVLITQNSDVTIFISEKSSYRNQLKASLIDQYHLKRCRVLSSYKPGFYWMVEEILPQLKEQEHQIKSIKIKCKNGKINKGLELPIRWLQELYPVDEIISQQLGLPMDKIDFEIHDDQQTVYIIQAYNAKADVVYEERFNVPLSQVNYVTQNKYAHPTTSYLSISTDNDIEEWHIKTDRERFYNFYQAEILPKIWHDVKGDLTEGSGFTKPLFNRLEVDLTLSEDEIELEVEEETISSLEALHEDIYFNTLDYFEHVGKKEMDMTITAPGGIHPFLKHGNDQKPYADIRVYHWQEENKMQLHTKKLIFNKHEPYPREVSLSDGKYSFTQQINDENMKQAEVPTYILLPEKVAYKQWYIEDSFLGEPIFALEVFKEMKTSHYACLKMSQYKPTVLIEATHHANEVSSLPATKKLMDEFLAVNPDILNHLNIVFIPCANPDGLQLHKKLTLDNPKWKHHAARYNAVGLEYTDVRYLESHFGEGNVVPKIMNKWAPDIVIDNHGIPSHEWTQPFAGYHIPPRFNMSFWIPNAFLYGIAKQLNIEKYGQHNRILQHIMTSIEAGISNTFIEEKNKYWLDRYKKYGHNFMPEMFPIESERDFIFYKWDTNVEKDSRTHIGRFPEWVSADIISEVTDETVYGQMKDNCVTAQYLFNKGAIEWLDKNDQMIEKSYQGQVKINRLRPLRVEEKK